MPEPFTHDPVHADLDEWVDGLDVLLEALGTPVRNEAPPPRVWAGIERRIASTPQYPR